MKKSDQDINNDISNIKYHIVEISLKYKVSYKSILHFLIKKLLNNILFNDFQKIFNTYALNNILYINYIYICIF